MFIFLGPTAYMLPPTVGKINHDKTRKENPAWSMGLKLESQLIINRGPGPIYNIPNGMTAKGPKPQLYATIKSRTKIPGESLQTLLQVKIIAGR